MQQKTRRFPHAFFLIPVLCFLVLLCACSKEAENDQTVISNRSNDAFSKITVEGGAGSYSIVKQGDDFICAELSGAAPDAAAIEKLTEGCTTLLALEVPGALITDEQYALVKPAARVTIEYTDGAQLLLYVGAVAQENENGTTYFFNLDGKNIVYTSDDPIFEYFLGGPGMFAKLALTSFDYASGDLGKPDSISLKTRNEELALQKLATPTADGYGNTYEYTLAGGTFADSDSFAYYFGNCGSIYAASAILAADAAPLASYGLSDPSATLTVSYGGKSETLIFGAKNPDGLTYAMKSGDDTVYLVAPRFTPFLEADMHSLSTRFIAAPAMEDVLNITVMTPGNGEFHVIDIYGSEARVEGAVIDSSTFSGLYRLLCSLQAEYRLTESAENVNAGSVHITFRLADASTLSVKLVPYEEGRYAIFMNGEDEAHYAVRAAFCEKLLNTLAQLTNGQIIDPAW